MIKLKDHLHVAFRKALVAPAHVVIAGPRAVHVAMEEIIQTCGSIRQLAKAFSQSAGGKKERKMTALGENDSDERSNPEPQFVLLLIVIAVKSDLSAAAPS